MANTKIQIKRSSATATPTNGSLQAGELAYSYNSDKLFLGTANSANVQEIGGTYWINTTIAAFNQANVGGTGAAIGNNAANSANAYTVTVGAAGNSYTNQVGAASNTWANTIAQNWANTRLANVVATSGRTTVTWSTTNGYTNATLDLATTTVAAATYGGADQIPSFTVDAYGRLTLSGNNAYLPTVYAFANTRANSSNAYTDTVGAAANTYANTLSTADRAISNNAANSANAYTVTVGAASNNYANTTFYAKSGGTISGDVSITGNLIVTKALNVTGNVTFTNTTSLVVSDPLLYLAGNNYTSDVVDIGFVANYNNGSANLHTGLYREHATKQYYLFQNYNQEPENNHIDPSANGFQLAALNAEIITSNLNLGGANAITWINSLYPYANGVANSSNAYSVTIGASSNAWANAVGTAGNNYTNAVGTAGNNYTNQVGAASNTWANTIAQNWANTRLANVVATSGRTTVAWSTTNGYTNATIDLATTTVSATTYGGATQIPVFTVDAYGRLTYAANVAVQGMDYAYANSIGAASNTWANTISQNWANTRLANVVAGTGTTVTWTTTNGYTNATVGLAATTVAAATYGGTNQIASFTVDAQGRLTFAGNNGINVGAATAGTLPVARGGTGNTTFTANSVLIGDGTSPVWGLFSSTEGHVLQVSAAGAPQFAMLDGGSF